MTPAAHGGRAEDASDVLPSALSADVAAGVAVTTSPGAPSSDESRGLAGVGGIDTLQPTAVGRVSGSFHGGFRFVLLTLSSPGSVFISAARVDFQALRATPADYRGWFLSSDDQLNRMWYSGAYTNSKVLYSGPLQFYWYVAR